MSDLSVSRELTTTGMQAQARRLRHLSENIANADTPGFHRKLIEFEQAENGGVAVGRVQLDRSELPKVYDPAHPMADETGHYQGSNVDLMIEIADAREAQRTYEANLKIFDQARQMSSSLYEVLRR